MSLIKSKEGGTVHRAGYQQNLSRIRIRILRFLNTKILKILKYSNSKELKWTEGGVGCQPKLKCYQGLSPLRPVHLKILSWEILNWPETRSNHFFCPSSGIKGENQKWKKLTGDSGQNWFAIQLSSKCDFLNQVINGRPGITSLLQAAEKEGHILLKKQ